MKRLVLLLTACLAGCATYQLDLMPRGAGAMAHGEAHQIDKSVAITIGSETYHGRYAYVQGGAYSLATMGGTTTTALGVSAVGNGNMLASAADGHNLRCVFSFSGWSQQGAGECLTDGGQLYDLQISR
jgi:hypothetical protein